MWWRAGALLGSLVLAYLIALAAGDGYDAPVTLMLFVVALGGAAAGRLWAPLLAFAAMFAWATVLGFATAGEGDDGGMPGFAVFIIFCMYGAAVAAAVLAGVLVRLGFDAWIGWVRRTRVSG